MFESNRVLGELLPQPKLEWITELPRGRAATADVVLHISCNANYTLFIPYLAQEILRRLQISFITFGGPESCCGSRQFNMGDHDLEEQNAKLALGGFARVKPQLLVTVCPDCDEVFGKFGSPASARFDIENLSGLLPRYLDALKPMLKPLKRRVVIHRHVSDAAREQDTANIKVLLSAIPGVEIVELQHEVGPGIHCQSLRPMAPEDQEAMFAEAVQKGVDTIVMPYHSCYRQHIKMELQHPVRVEHYLGLLAESLGIEYDEPLKVLRLLDDLDAAMEKLRPLVQSHGWDEEMVRSFVKSAVYM